jgi:hypothetical protein
MPDDNSTSVANRENQIPTISITNSDDTRPKSPATRQRSKSSSRIDQLRASQSAAAAKIRSKLEDKFSGAGADGTKVDASPTMQDRLLNMCVLHFYLARNLSFCLLPCVVPRNGNLCQIVLPRYALHHTYNSTPISVFNCSVAISVHLLPSVLCYNLTTCD